MASIVITDEVEIKEREAQHRIAEQKRIRKEHRKTCGKRGTFNRRHLYTDRSGDREIIFHATKGYRSYRKT